MTAPALIQNFVDNEAFKVSGRFMLPDQSEHTCVVADFHATGAMFLSSFGPPAGTEIVAYLEEIGRIEVVCGEPRPFGFLANFAMSDARLERLHKRIASLKNPGEDAGITHRRHQRFEPSDRASHLTLSDGRVYPCEVNDISVSGAGLKSDVVLALGTFVMLGKTPGKVVRYTENGFALAFAHHIDVSQLAAKA